MSDSDRTNRISLSYLDAKRLACFVFSETWPRQIQPTKTQIRLWKRFITSSYLRYIPYWKIPPATQQPAEPVATIEPINLSDYGENIATCLTRTEQRLLDGLVQVATDLKIWRAFRSKARLHLASDGGLGDNSATHGWL
jgi:hypothetical protein